MRKMLMKLMPGLLDSGQKVLFIHPMFTERFTYLKNLNLVKFAFGKMF